MMFALKENSIIEENTSHNLTPEKVKEVAQYCHSCGIKWNEKDCCGLEKVGLPRWPSGPKRDSYARGRWFDSHVEQKVLLSVFYEILSSSSEFVPD